MARFVPTPGLRQRMQALLELAFFDEEELRQFLGNHRLFTRRDVVLPAGTPALQALAARILDDALTMGVLGPTLAAVKSEHPQLSTNVDEILRLLAEEEHRPTARPATQPPGSAPGRSAPGGSAPGGSAPGGSAPGFPPQPTAQKKGFPQGELFGGPPRKGPSPYQSNWNDDPDTEDSRAPYPEDDDLNRKLPDIGSAFPDPGDVIGVAPLGAPSASTGLESTGVPPPLAPPQRVSLGFSAPVSPLFPMGQYTLARDELYLLWVELAPEILQGALAAHPPLPALVEGEVLDVIVFPFPKQLALEGPRHGRLEVRRLRNRVAQHAWREPRPDLDRPRLFFSFRTPKEAGRYALRCNIYKRGVLLQSHLVRAKVTKHAHAQAGAMDSRLDYNLSTTLDAARLPPERDCRVSLFINDDGRGTHSFRFVSSKDGVPDHR